MYVEYWWQNLLRLRWRSENDVKGKPEKKDCDDSKVMEIVQVHVHW
jgi:hypothetical protein